MAKSKKSAEAAPAAEPAAAPAVEPAADPSPAVEETPPEAVPAGDIPEGEMKAFLEDEQDDLDEAAPAAEAAPVVDADPGQAPAVEPAAVEPTVAAETPPAAAPPAEAPLAEAKPGEAKPEAPETPPAAEPPEQQPVAETAEELQARYADWRGKAEDALQREHYLLDEATVEALETDAAAAIPKLMSRVYLDAVTASVGHVMAAMPQLIGSMVQLQRQSDEVETRFFERWPQLTDHRDSVVRLGQAYRQVFPRASEEDFTRDVGAQTIIALRLPIEAQPAPAPAPVPFTPAASSPPGGRPQVKLNPFEQLAEEMAQEELDLG